MQFNIDTDYKSMFEETARTYIKRKGLDELLGALEQSDFYHAPASTKYHDSHEKGLVFHSLKVANILSGDLLWDDTISQESIAIVSLFHDICKCGYYKVEMRNAKIDGKWVQVPYYTIDDLLPLGHGEKSILLIKEYMELTMEEMMAIRWHMGGFEPKENYSTMSKAYQEYPLAMYLHLADMKATYLK